MVLGSLHNFVLIYNVFIMFYLLYYGHLPPNFNSAIAWALARLLVTEHWYIPLSSRPTFLTAKDDGVSSFILFFRVQDRGDKEKRDVYVKN